MKIQYRKKRLTTAERVKIATDYNAGILVKDIAAKYGITPEAVYYTLKKLAKEGNEPRT